MSVLSVAVLLPLAIAALVLVYFGGPSFWLLTLPFAVVVTALAAAALSERRQVGLWLAAAVGLLAVLVPVAQFALAD